MPPSLQFAAVAWAVSVAAASTVLVLLMTAQAVAARVRRVRRVRRLRARALDLRTTAPSSSLAEAPALGDPRAA